MVNRPTCLEQAGFTERIHPARQGISLRVADDDVIKKLDVEHLGSVAQHASHRDVGRARRRVPAWVVVLCDEPSYVECMRSFHSGFALRVGWIAAHS